MEIPCSQESQEAIIQAFGQAVELEYSGQNISQAPPKCSNIQNLVSILKRFLNITVVGKNQQKIFVEDLLKYIELVMIFLSTDMEYRKLRNYESIYMSFIPGIFKTVDFKNVFVQQATVKTLELVMYGPFNFVSKRAVLTIFNIIVSHSEKKVRNDVAKEAVNIMYNLLDCLESHGDFVLQSDILEILFRIFGQQIRSNKTTFILLPGFKDLGKDLLDISINDFDGDVRRWLNKFNQDSLHIFSIACKMIMFGNDVCLSPKDTDMWMDFNIKESMLSCYCESLNPGSWNRLIILAKDVKKVDVKRVLGASETIVSFEMTRPCISEIIGLQKHYDKLEKHLKLVIGNEEKEKIARLMTVVLPQMFGGTFSRLSSRISKSKSVYKPLPIKTSRPKSGSSEVSLRTTSSRSIMSDATTVVVPKISAYLSPGRSDEINSVKSGIDVPVIEKRSRGSMVANNEDITETNITRLSCVSPFLNNESNITFENSDILPSSKPASLIRSDDSNCYRKTGGPKLQDNIITSSHGDGEIPSSLNSKIEILSGRCSGRSADYQRLVREVSGFNPSELFSSSPVKFSSIQKNVQDVSSEFSAPSITKRQDSFQMDDPEICDIMSDFLTEDDTQHNETIVNSQEVVEECDSEAIFSPTTQLDLPRADQNTEEFMNDFSLAVNVGISENQFSDCLPSEKTISKPNINVTKNHDAPNMEVNSVKQETHANVNLKGGKKSHSKIIMEANKENIIDLTIDEVVRETNEIKKKINSNANKDSFEQVLPKNKCMWNTPQLLDCLEDDDRSLQETAQKNAETTDCTIKPKDEKVNVLNKAKIGGKPKTKKRKPRTTIKTSKKIFDLEEATNRQNIEEHSVTNKKKLHEKSTDSKDANLSKELQTATCPDVSSKENTIQKSDGLQSWEKTNENVEQICDKSKKDGKRIFEESKEYGEEICEKTKDNDEQIYEKTEQYGKQTCENSKQNAEQIFEKVEENRAVNRKDIPEKEPLKQCIKPLKVVLTKINVQQQYENSSSDMESPLAPEMNCENVDYIEAFDELHKSKGENKLTMAIQKSIEEVASDISEVFEKEQCIKQLNVVLTPINLQQQCENSSSDMESPLAPEMNYENVDYIEAFDELHKSKGENKLTMAIQKSIEEVASETSNRQTTVSIEGNDTSAHASEAEFARKINTEHVDNDNISNELKENNGEFILKKVARHLPETQEEVPEPQKVRVSSIKRKSKKGKGQKAAKLVTPKVKSSENDQQPECIKTPDLDMEVLPAKIPTTPEVGQELDITFDTSPAVRQKLIVTPVASPAVGQKLIVSPHTSPTIGQKLIVTPHTSPVVGQNLVVTPDASPTVGPKWVIPPDSSPAIEPQIITTFAQVHWSNEEPDKEAIGCKKTTRSLQNFNELSQEFKKLEELCVPKKNRKRESMIVEYISPVLKRTRASGRLKINQSNDDFEQLCQTAAGQIKNKSRANTTTSGNRSRKLFTPANLSYLDELPAIAEQKTPDSEAPIPVMTETKPKRKRVSKENKKSAEKRKSVEEKPSRKMKKSPKEKSLKEVSKPRSKGGKRKQFDFPSTNLHQTLNEMFADVGEGFGRWNNQSMDIAVRSAPQYSSSDNDSPLVKKSTRHEKNASPKIPKTIAPQTPPTPDYNSSDLEIEPYHKNAVPQKKINIQQHIIIPPKRPLQNLTSNEDAKRRKIHLVTLPTLQFEEPPLPALPLEEPAALVPAAEYWVKGVKLAQYIFSLLDANSPSSFQMIDALFEQMCDLKSRKS